MNAHSRIGASSMSRWSVCAASVRLSANMPNTSSSFAQEGTKAHELAELLLTKSIYKDDLSQFDDEMVETVGVYVDFVREESEGADYVGVEERFELTELHPELFGTADAVILKGKTLIVADLKYGKGLAVEVENNKQLLFYTLGALMKTKAACSHVEMVIVQPRCFHPDGPIRRWKVSVTELIDFSADLVDYALATEDPNAPIVPGDHCRFCPAAPVCPSLHETAIATAQEEFSPAFSYDPEKLKDVLTKIPAIEAWAKSVKEFAFREAQAGRCPPGFKLVPKRATRKWSNEEQAQQFLLFELGLDYMQVHKEPAMKSPAQIEALLPTKEDKKRLEEIVSKESSGDTLAPIADKRKTSKPAVETEFTKIEE